MKYHNRMLINKVMTGFVIQQFDTETRRFVRQEFIGGDAQWEYGENEPLDLDTSEKDRELVYGLGGVDMPHLNMEMVQPLTTTQIEAVRNSIQPLLAQSTSFEVGERVIVMPSGNPADLVCNEFMGTVVEIKEGIISVKDFADDVFDVDPVQVHHVK
jgi:hypothetical protein